MGPVTSPGGAPSRGVAIWLRARSGLDAIETVLAWISAACILAAGLYIVAGIVLRTAFNSGTYDELVIVSELMVGAIVLPLALVCAKRGFIAVEVVSGLLGARTQRGLDLLSDAIGLLAVIPMLIAGALALGHILEDESFYFGMLNLPKWPGYVVFVVGYAVFAIRLLDLLVHDLLRGLGAIPDAAVVPPPAEEHGL